MTNDTHDMKKKPNLFKYVPNSLTEQMVVSTADAILLSPTAKTQYLVKVALRTEQHLCNNGLGII